MLPRLLLNVRVWNNSSNFYIKSKYKNEIDGIENIEPMTHCLDDFIYELRSDIEEESISIEEILQNCDNKTDREVIVPKVVG